MAATSSNGSGGVSSNGSNNGSKSGNGVLRFKNGPYLTPKVERIMLQIARGRPVEWIAELYGVRESFVYYVARKTGFPASAVIHECNDRESAEDPQQIDHVDESELTLEPEEDLIAETVEHCDEPDEAW